MKPETKIWAGYFVTLLLLIGLISVGLPLYLKVITRRGGDAERLRDTASALEARGLYAPALEELQRYRDQADLDREQEAGLLNKMARLADEKIGDCGRALNWYTMAVALDPDAGWANEAGKRSVTCMEKAGKSRQAQALLKQLTDEKPSPVPADGPVVAVIDGHSVTWDQITTAMSMSVDPKKMDEPDYRSQLLQQYVFKRLLAEEARRAGMESEPALQPVLDQARIEALAAAFARRKFDDKTGQSELQKFTDEMLRLHEVRIFNEAIPSP